jgi:hypothetical protein
MKPEILEVIATRLAEDQGLEPEGVLRVLAAVADDRKLAAAIEREDEVGVPVTVGQVNDAMVGTVSARLAREEGINQPLLEEVLNRLSDGAGGIGSAIAREVGGGWPVTLPEIGEAVAAEQARVSPFISLPEPKSVEELIVTRLLRYAAAKGYDRVEFAPGFKVRGLSPRVRALADRLEREEAARRARRRRPLPEHGGEAALMQKLGGPDAYEAHRAYLGLDERPAHRRSPRGHEAAAVAKLPPWPVERADAPVGEYELLSTEPGPHARRRQEFVRKLEEAAKRREELEELERRKRALTDGEPK